MTGSASAEALCAGRSSTAPADRRQFAEGEVPFPLGADPVLHTDRLAESRTRDLTPGVEWLPAGIPRVPAAADPGPAWDTLIEELPDGRHDDDIALIHVRHRGDDGA